MMNIINGGVHADNPIDFHSRIAAAVENFTADDVDNSSHGGYSFQFSERMKREKIIAPSIAKGGGKENPYRMKSLSQTKTTPFPEPFHLLCVLCLRNPIKRHQRLKKTRHLIQRNHVWSIRWRITRVFVGFYEHARNADCDGGARQCLDELALAAG